MTKLREDEHEIGDDGMRSVLDRGRAGESGPAREIRQKPLTLRSDRMGNEIEVVAAGGREDEAEGGGRGRDYGQDTTIARRDGGPATDAADAEVGEPRTGEINHVDHPLELEFDLSRLDDCNGDGSLFLSTVRLLGRLHHLTLLRVRWDPGEGMVADMPSVAEDFRNLWRLYEGPYHTVEVPGYRGIYIAYVHPYGA
jgi:hypothetical protein